MVVAPYTQGVMFAIVPWVNDDVMQRARHTKCRVLCFMGSLPRGIQFPVCFSLSLIKCSGLILGEDGTGKEQIVSTYLGAIFNMIKDPHSSVEHEQTHWAVHGPDECVSIM